MLLAKGTRARRSRPALGVDALLKEASLTMIGDQIDVSLFLNTIWRKDALTKNLDAYSYLAGAMIGATPYVGQLQMQSEPRFNDSIDAFRERHADPETQARLRNSVKICAKCGKPCAVTLENCNACGASLKEIPLSYNDNVFMGFVYGIAKGKFPYKISLRAQTPDFLCFDDPLQVSPCHLNVIPTSVYCADLRYLFTDPPRGLALLEQMFDLAATTALEQYWGDEAFHKKIFRGAATPKKRADSGTQRDGTWSKLPTFDVPAAFAVHPSSFVAFPSRYVEERRALHQGTFLPSRILAEGPCVRLCSEDASRR